MLLRRLLFPLITVQFFIFSCLTKEKQTETVPEKDTESSLEQLVKEYPDSAILTQKLIEIYRDSARYDKAIKLTDEQVRKDSLNAFLWNMKATLHFEDEDTANALQALEAAVKIYPLPEYLLALGTVYAEIKNPKALQIADTLSEANTSKYEDDAFFIRGLYYTYTGQKSRAITLFDSALARNYTYMYAYREKAIALYDLGKYNAAVNTLNRAVTVQNNFEEGHYWLGKCYEKLGMPDQAIESYQHALLYDKKYFEAREALQRLQNELNK